MAEKSEKRDSKVTIQGIKTLGDLSETAITQAAGIVRSLYGAAKSNPLLGVAAFLFTMDFLQKLNLIYPNTAQAGREACFQAIGLQLNFQNSVDFKSWEQSIPIIGFFLTSSNISVDTILSTSMTVDATGGETVVKAGVEETGNVLQALSKLLPQATP